MKITSAHVLALVALVASVGGGLAVAHDGDTDKLHFCIDNGDRGDVRAVKPDGACGANETATDVRIQHVGYHEVLATKSFDVRPGYQLASKRLYVPANGDSYLLSAKLTVSKPGPGGKAGVVTCKLRDTEKQVPDIVRATVRPGEFVPMAFSQSGVTDGRPGQVASSDIRCKAPDSTFRVTHARVTAVPVNTVSRGTPVS